MAVLAHRKLWATLCIALVAWMAGVGPFFAQAVAHGFELSAYEDPCSGCPDDAEEREDSPCSPFCADCLCGQGQRVTTTEHVLWRVGPVLAAKPAPSGPAFEQDPPLEPAAFELLRPPRA